MTEDKHITKFSEFIKFSDRQSEAFSYIGKKSRILYGGARGGGKTAWAVAVAILSALQFPGLRVAIIRKNLDDLKAQIILNELLKRYPQTFYTYKTSEKTAYFNNGSVIFFRSIERPADALKEQGIERGLYILDEGNQLSQEVIEMLTGSLRAFDQPNWKPTLIITANPGGVCDDYVKSRWVRPDYTKWEEAELKLKDEYVFIPATVDDNPHATDEYRTSLDSLSEDLRRAWRYGDWDVFSGKFFTEWQPRRHICEPFDIPKDWVRWRAVDLGYQKHPSVCLFGTQDPETGRVYIYDEVSTKDHTDVFIEEIVSVSGDDEFVDTLFDPGSLSGRKDTADQMSPAQMFLYNGIPVSRANNERENGWRNLKQWISWREDEEPMLKVFPNCLGLIETIPIQRFIQNKFDLDTKGQDDYVDAARYLTSHLIYGHIYNGPDSYEKIDPVIIRGARQKRNANNRESQLKSAYIAPSEYLDDQWDDEDGDSIYSLY